MNRVNVALIFVAIAISGRLYGDELGTLRILNSESSEPILGAIVEFDETSISTVIDLLGDAPLNVPVGWTSSNKHDAKYVSLGSRGVRCVNGMWVPSESLWLWTGELTESRLSDPFQTLEVFNRRLTGLGNNEEAEIRLLQWRSTIREGVESGHKLYLVTGVVMGKSPTLVAIGEGSETSIAALLQERSERMSFMKISDECSTVRQNNKVRAEMNVDSPVVVSVVMRRIVFGDDIVTPRARYNFAFGESVSVDCKLIQPGR